MTSASSLIWVSTDGDSRAPPNAIACELGVHVQINERRIESYCQDLLPFIGHDIALLIGSVAYADRTLKRRRSEGWARSIHIRLPVLEYDLWKNRGVEHSLEDVLSFVSGDVWTFEFVKRKKRPPSREQFLKLETGQYAVIPFSNGLDSFAQWKLSSLDESDTEFVKVTTVGSAVTQEPGWRLKDSRQRSPRLGVPLRLSGLRHPEPTYRTRTFTYYVLAGLAAFLIRSSRVIIPENGQGALGASLVPSGDEWPHRGSHPAYTRRISAFLNRLLGSNLVFEHPRLWDTKGQVLTMLRDRGILDGWLETRSCARGAREGFANIHCGICGGCLLRRLSAATASVSEEESRYAWALSNEEDFERAAKYLGRSVTKNDRDIAVHSALPFEHLSKLACSADSQQTKRALSQAAFAIDGDRVSPTTIKKLTNLLIRHQNEWESFSAGIGTSWLNTYLAHVR